MINLKTKYSTASYEDLCFDHAVQEVMRDEKVTTEIIQHPPESECDSIIHCALCAIIEAERENRLAEWYRKYKEKNGY